MSAKRLPTLLRELSRHGFEIVEAQEDQAVIRDRDENLYVLTSAESWVHAAQMLFEAAEMQGPAYNDLTVLALRLHSRFLGCRIGFDEDQNLAVQYDVYPDMSVEHVIVALEQLNYIGSVALELFRDVLAGVAVDEERIDRAFDVT